MYKYLRPFACTAVLVLSAHLCFAPPPPGNTGRTDPAGGAPIDGMIGLLIAGGSALAFSQLRKKR